jgi:hypothetical protein
MIYAMKPLCKCGGTFSGFPLVCNMCGSGVTWKALRRAERAWHNWLYFVWYPFLRLIRLLPPVGGVPRAREHLDV